MARGRSFGVGGLAPYIETVRQVFFDRKGVGNVRAALGAKPEKRTSLHGQLRHPAVGPVELTSPFCPMPSRCRPGGLRDGCFPGQERALCPSRPLGIRCRRCSTPSSEGLSFMSVSSGGVVRRAPGWELWEGRGHGTLTGVRRRVGSRRRVWSHGVVELPSRRKGR